MTAVCPPPRCEAGLIRSIPILTTALSLGGCGFGGDAGQGAGDAGLDLFQSVLFISVILVAVILVGGVIAMFARSRFRAAENAPTIGFTLEDLRRMHERGEMTLDEFENARANMLGKVRGTEGHRPSASESRVSGRIPPPKANQNDVEPNQDD